MVHVFRPRALSDGVNIKERFCRPGAAFGPAAVEERMGVELVFHEMTKRLPCGRMVCTTCRLVEV